MPDDGFGSIGALADLPMIEVAAVDADVQARDIDAWFRNDAAVTAVIVKQADGELALVTREALFSALTGPNGFGWSLHARRAIRHIAISPALVLEAGTPIPVAAAAALARPMPSRYDEVVVRLASGGLALTQVTPLFARLADGFARQSTHDPLTGLGNRAMLAQVARSALAEAAAGDALPAVVVLDLDRFKEVNDALGHDAGDELLIRVGKALADAAAIYGTVTRLGGDEFAVLIPDLSHFSRGGPAAFHSRLSRLGHELLRQAQGPYLIGGIPITVEGSLGIAHAPEHGTDLGTLLRRADAAMYDAKRAGTHVAVWAADSTTTTSTELSMLAELRTGIQDNQLRLMYQPIVDAITGQVSGVEALVRWQHDSLGLLGPNSFIAMAERSGVIHELTSWVLRQSLRQLGQWARAGLPVQLSVNISALSLVHGDIVATVARLLAEHGIEPQWVTLEVTESAVMSAPYVAAQRLRALRALGVRLSLDDFGTGYTSLGLLRDLPFDELKVDRTFVAGALLNAPDAAIVHSVLELGHRLGLEVVAEGVADAVTMDMLVGLGFDRLQGYWLGRPQAAHPMTDLLADRVPTSRLRPRLSRNAQR